jgi:hypothetical protein
MPSEGARPRYGVTLDGVTRPAGTLAPRWRQAPDGPKSGGTQSTDISVINRRVLLAPPRPMDNVKPWAPSGLLQRFLLCVFSGRLSSGKEGVMPKHDVVQLSEDQRGLL